MQNAKQDGLGLHLGHLLLFALGLQNLKYLLPGPLEEKLAGSWPALIGLAETEEDGVYQCETLLVTADRLF